MLKISLIFLVGLASGWILLWQIQGVANSLENDCVKHSQKTGYDCQSEIEFSESVYNVK